MSGWGVNIKAWPVKARIPLGIPAWDSGRSGRHLALIRKEIDAAIEEARDAWKLALDAMGRANRIDFVEEQVEMAIRNMTGRILQLEARTK